MTSRTALRRLCVSLRRGHVRNLSGARLLTPLARSVLPQHGRESTNTGQFYQSHVRGLSNKAGEGMVINIQDEKDFEERVMKSDKPVVVDFHASWCGPCKLLGPRLESLVGSKEGKVVLAKIDVDENMEIANRFNINSVPTVMAFKNRNLMDKFVGLQDDAIIETFLNRLIG